MDAREAGSEAPAAHAQRSESQPLHELKVTYEIDGQVIRVVRKQVTEKYAWFLKGNSSWREW
jgi:hypothetical protein